MLEKNMITRDNLKELKKGDRLHIKSVTFIHPEATYRAEVINIFKHVIHLKIAPIPETMSDEMLGEGGPIPYSCCVQKTNIGIGVKMWKVA